MTMPETSHAPAARAKFKLFLKLALIAGIILAVNYGGGTLIRKINIQLWPEHEHLIVTALWLSIGLYILWMALPFVPGIELGLGLMVLLGIKGVILVYLCTLISLSLSFAIGKRIPLNVIARLLGWLRLNKSRDMAHHLKTLSSEQKIDYLLKTAPVRIVPFLLKHRYLMIALVLNLPGNALIGGGGGIGLVTGMSGICSFPKYFLLISVAITPLPLLFLAGRLSV